METIAQDLATMVRQAIAPEHVERMREIGHHFILDEGDTLFAPGDEFDRFLYVEEGEVEVVDPLTSERIGGATLGPTQFGGDIAFLTGGTFYLHARALCRTRILVVPREAMLSLMSQIPELSDLIVTVFAARRRRTIENRFGALTLVGPEDERSLARIVTFAARNRLPWRHLPPGSIEEQALRAQCHLPTDVSAVVVGESDVLVDATPKAVAEKLGMALLPEADDVFDVLVIGGGPAGIAAGVYAGAEGLSSLVVEDLAIGGQAGASSRIENYMGFPTGISGGDLCWRGEVQAMRLGTRFAIPHRVAGLAKASDGTFHATLDDGQTVGARAVVIASGVQYRRVPIDRLDEFEGAGIYYAATEIEARRCRDTDAVVIGGGNSAGQAAMFLSRTAAHVHVLVRGPTLATSMSDYLLSRLENDPAITIHYDTSMIALDAEDRLTAITIKNTRTGEERSLRTKAIFIMIGAAPNTQWLAGLAELDEKGFVLTGPEYGGGSPFETSHPGIFAVGDVRAGSVKRVASAVGEGSVVISKVWEFVRG